MNPHEHIAALRKAADRLCTCGKTQHPTPHKHKYRCPTREAQTKLDRVGILFRYFGAA